MSLPTSSAVPLHRRVLLKTQVWALRRVDRVAARYGRSRKRPRHLLIGEAGEREALFGLRQAGYTVVARRWQSSRTRGDVDLIAWQGDWLCFIEVKTRARRNPLDPAEAAVDQEKQRVLRKLARAYLRGFPESRRDSIRVRFDIIAVYLDTTGPAIEIFPDAFAWRSRDQ